jgi:N-acetylneuraminic acid mutarotase
MMEKLRNWTIVIAAAAALSAAGRDAGAFTWQPRADVIGEIFGRGLHGGGTINNKIYLAGGGFIGTSLWMSYKSMVIYDPVADSWVSGPDMTSLRTAPAAAVADFAGEPRLYVIGGMDLTDFPFDQFNNTTIEEYDPILNQWRTPAATLPDIMTWGSCAVTVDNRIYIMGGADDTFGTLATRVVSYDPDTDSLSVHASMPAAVSDGACAAVGRKIYWFSGYQGQGAWGLPPGRITYMYDVDQNQWSESASLIPTPRVNPGAIAVGTIVYVIGGYDGSGEYSGLYNSIDAYDTVSDSWTANVPDPLGCLEDDGQSARGRAGLTLHIANDGTQDLLFAVGGNLGMSLPTRCNEAAPLVEASDTTPPSFGGLETADEVFCTVPEVVLGWSAGTDSETPPVTYNIYRGDNPTFVPDAASLIAGGVTALTYTDTLTLGDCSKTYWYVVRAQDSALPPNEDPNTLRVQVDLQCQPPSPPAGIGNRLFAVKDPSGDPSLDWHGYTPPPEVTHYHVRRTDTAPAIPGGIVAEPTLEAWIDTAAGGSLLFYDVRSAIDCNDIESGD